MQAHREYEESLEFEEEYDEGQLQEECEESRIVLTDVLISHGIKKEDVEKLKKAGLYTVDAVAFTPRKTLLEIKGFSDAKVDSILAAVSKENSVTMGFISAQALRVQRKKSCYDLNWF
ncbi:recombinase rad51 [Entomophthora muscae]|uniref:Recombinase rad51 n=1 Tax=Entomophthora muscae TaxID=34485 RepID=A0ACC2ULW6_9FUNG|nr:recombinase rad51 [Entomophthora muscae]